jgi:hypothetical protein
MSFMNWLFGAMDTVKGAKLEHPLAQALPTAAAKDEKAVDGSAFVPGANYFGVRLAGLHLVNARTFTTELLPLCVCLSEYNHGGEMRGVPFSIGPDVIRQRLKTAEVDTEAKPAWVELRDLTVIPPTPVTSGNLSLYTGLFSVPGDDLTKSLLNMVGQLGQSIGAATALSAGQKIAETVYSGFGSLLGLNTVTQVVAALNGRILTNSRYYLVANVPAEKIQVNELSVQDGRLYRGQTPVSDFDYCLFALECFPSVVDASQLAPQFFFQNWKAVIDALQEDPGSAPRSYRRLQGAILNSPDLVEADRDILMAAYLALYEKRAKTLGVGEQAALTRGHGARGVLLSVAEQVEDLRTNRETGLAERLESIVAAVRQEPAEPQAKPEAEILATARRLRGSLGSSAELSAGVSEALFRSAL